MILSPHILTRAGRRYVVVIRHPPDDPPNARYHDVVAEICPLRGTASRVIEQGFTVARSWIAEHEIEGCPPLPGYGLADRVRWKKTGHRDARERRANLIRAIRAGATRDAVEAEYGAKTVGLVLKKWPILAARYPRRAHKKRGGSQVTTGGSASVTLLTTLLKIADALAKYPTMDELQAVQQPPMAEVTVRRHLNLLQDCLEMRIQKSGSQFAVLHWGRLNPGGYRGG